MRTMSPCRDCPDRTVIPENCHKTCEKYLAYQKTTKAYRETVKRAKDHEHQPRTDADVKRYNETLKRRGK